MSQDFRDQPDWRDADTRAVHEELAEWVKWLRKQPPGSKRLGDLHDLNDLLDRLPPDEGASWLDEHQPDINRVTIHSKQPSQLGNEGHA